WPGGSPRTCPAWAGCRPGPTGGSPRPAGGPACRSTALSTPGGGPGPGRGDLMSILTAARDDETGACMTVRQLRDEATTLVIAGSETTGNTIAWACYLLTKHPEVQDRLQQEADQVLDGRD